MGEERATGSECRGGGLCEVELLANEMEVKGRWKFGASRATGCECRSGWLCGSGNTGRGG